MYLHRGVPRIFVSSLFTSPLMPFFTYHRFVNLEKNLQNHPLQRYLGNIDRKSNKTRFRGTPNASLVLWRTDTRCLVKDVSRKNQNLYFQTNPKHYRLGVFWRYWWLSVLPCVLNLSVCVYLDLSLNGVSHSSHNW